MGNNYSVYLNNTADLNRIPATDLLVRCFTQVETFDWLITAILNKVRPFVHSYSMLTRSSA